MAIMIPTRSKTGRTDLPAIIQSAEDEAISGVAGLTYWYNGAVGRISSTSLLDRINRAQGRYASSPLPAAYASARFGGAPLLDFTPTSPPARLRTASRLLSRLNNTMIVIFEFPAEIALMGEVCYTSDETEATPYQAIRINSDANQIGWFNQGSGTTDSVPLIPNTAYFAATSVAQYVTAGTTYRRYTRYGNTLTPIQNNTAVEALPDLSLGFGLGPRVSTVAGVRVGDALAFNRELSIDEVGFVVGKLKAKYGIA